MSLIHTVCPVAEDPVPGSTGAVVLLRKRNPGTLFDGIVFNNGLGSEECHRPAPNRAIRSPRFAPLDRYALSAWADENFAP